MRVLSCAALTALLSLGGCAAPRASTAGDEVTVVLNVEPSNLNPILASDSSDNFVDGLLFNLLTTIVAKGRIVPDLAADVPSRTNGGISADGRTITFHLRRNVRWQDGVRFTSRDVAFTWRAIMNPRNRVVSRSGYDLVQSVQTPDDFTVVFRLRRPFAAAVTSLFGEGAQPLRIIPAHLLSRYADLNAAAFNSRPVGTGPYVFERWSRGNEIALRANARYFRGAPRIPRMHVRIVPNAETEGVELRTGEADLAVEISPQLFHLLRGVPGIRLFDPPVPSFEAIEIDDARAPLNDARVRRAIALAIDRRALERTVEHGESRLASGPLDSGSWAYEGSLPRPVYAPNTADRLLDSAGFRLDANGVRSRGGVPLRLTFAYGQGSPSAQALAIEVQSMLRATGIDVVLRPYAFEMLFAPYAGGGILATGKFDLALYAAVTGPDPNDALSMFTCSERPPNGTNFARYCNAAYDAAVAAGNATTVRKERVRDYAHAQRILTRDVPVAFLFWFDQLHAASTRLHGFEPNAFTESWNAEKWRLR